MTTILGLNFFIWYFKRKEVFKSSSNIAQPQDPSSAAASDLGFLTQLAQILGSLDSQESLIAVLHSLKALRLTTQKMCPQAISSLKMQRPHTIHLYT